MAVVRLDGAGVDYDELPHPPGTRDGLSLAQQLGLPYDRVFKTLVVVGGPGLIALVVLPLLARLDEAAAAKVLGWRKVTLATHPTIRDRLGVEPAVVSPLVLPELPLLADDSVTDGDDVWIGAGPGVEVRLSATDFVTVTEPRLAPLRR